MFCVSCMLVIVDRSVDGLTPRPLLVRGIKDSQGNKGVCIDVFVCEDATLYVCCSIRQSTRKKR